MGPQLARIVQAIGSFYGILIIVYVLMSWFTSIEAVDEIRRVLGTVVEPYISLFRRIIPPIGMIDISPIVAYLVLQLVLSYVIVPLLGSL
ncbi:MAG: YggT family protein [Coriobacteriales bacterium]|nr:YggT family protein [Coriobacteriales bacterium]